MNIKKKVKTKKVAVKFTKQTKKNTNTVSKAKKKTWKVFSLYIRQRDCLKTTGLKNQGRCFTCHVLYPVSQLQAGHFIPGRKSMVLFDERNVHAQCYRCNIHLKGNLIMYYPKMIKVYGQDVIEELKMLNNQVKKFTVPELQDLFSRYTIKLYE